MKFIAVLVLIWAIFVECNHIKNFKIHSDSLDEISRSMRGISDGDWHADLNNFDTEDQPDYKGFFSEVLLKNEFANPFEAPKINQREKRFLRSLLDLLKKNKTKPNPHKTDHDFFDSFADDDEDDFSNHRKPSTTARPIFFSSTTKARPIVTTAHVPSPLPSAAQEDPFYRLKNHCAVTYDQLCSSKKSEMYELVKKCDRLKMETGNQRLEPCREVYSVYCYVFYDRFTCIGQDYDTYIPGRKKYTTSSARPTAFSTRGTSGQTIKINVITNKPVTTTTRSYVITTTTTRPRPTTKAVVTTTKPVVTTTKVTTKTTHKPHVTSGGSGVGEVNPFPPGPLQIPNSADKLKEIGDFCVKTKTKEPRCDTMLKLLKDKFKVCEKKPKTDNECQTFKIQFCTAYTNFPCCPDVLAGRTCSGKSNSAAKRMMYM